MPRISVLIPVYNGERYLTEALQSVLADHDSDLEVITVDDGSTDQTPKILKDLAAGDNRLKVITRPNTGVVGALNDGLAACTGEYIARMDADDVVYLGRFQAQQAYLDNHPECVGLGSWVQYLDPDGEPIWTWKMTADAKTIEDHLLNGTIGGLVHPAMMLRREAVMAAGAYRQECQYVEDYDLFLRLLEHGSFSVIEKCLLGYRQHLGSINATKDQQTRTAITNRLLADARSRRSLSP
ncbi:MAG: glycosyltransferase family 2 protein, partial [Verrucomicrobiota bacterium]